MMHGRGVSELMVLFAINDVHHKIKNTIMAPLYGLRLVKYDGISEAGYKLCAHKIQVYKQQNVFVHQVDTNKYWNIHSKTNIIGILTKLICKKGEICLQIFYAHMSTS